MGMTGLVKSTKNPRKFALFVSLSVLLLLSACGGGGGAASPAPVGGNPTASIANVSVTEGNTGTTNMVFTVTLSTASASAVSVNYATSDGTALSASDYTATTASLTIPAGSTTGTITVIVSADTTYEANETLTVTLSSPTNATLGTATATGTILNDDAGGINDTGITKWGNASSNTLTTTQAAFPVQDADVGRDANASLNSASDGRVGFSFTKLDSAGTALANQAATYGSTPWDCLKDNVTGLMWKRCSEGQSWSGTTCTGAAATYIWQGALQQAETLNNGSGFAGYTNWRVPNLKELNSIVEEQCRTPIINAALFPTTTSNIYWSASPEAGTTDSAWGVKFSNGLDVRLSVSVSSSVRLVRGGQ